MENGKDQQPNPNTNVDQPTSEAATDNHNTLLNPKDFNPIQIANQIADSITKNDSDDDANESDLNGNGTTPISQKDADAQDMAPSNDSNDTEEKEKESNQPSDSDKKTDQSEKQDESNENDNGELEDATKKISDVLITGFDQPRLNSETLEEKNQESDIKNDENDESAVSQEKDENQDDSKNSNEKEKSENDDLEQEIDKIIKSNSASQTKSKNYLLSYVRKCQIDKMLETDYVAANRYRICETIIQNQIYIDDHQYSNASRNQSIDRRIENLKRTREQIEREWDDRFESFKQKTEERQKKMEECHKKEFEEFEQRWGSEDFMSNFNKASPSLLQLRQRQKIQALSKDFTGAKVTKELADQLQKQEEIENEKIAISTMKKQYALMIEKHKNESECAQENWERHKKFLQDEKERNLKLIDRTTQQLENRRSQPISNHYRPIVTPAVRSRTNLTAKSSTGSISSLNRTNRPTTTTNLRAVKSNNTQSSNSSLPDVNNNNDDTNNANEDISNNDQDENYKNLKTSPRTRKTLVEYRNRPNNTKLNIPAINVSQQLYGTGKSTKQSFKPRMTRRYRNYNYS